MKVIVDSNLVMPPLFKPPTQIELKDSGATLKGLLEELSCLSKILEFISGDKIGENIQTVLINGKEQFSLNTKLNEGDKIMIVVGIEPIGGG